MIDLMKIIRNVVAHVLHQQRGRNPSPTDGERIGIEGTVGKATLVEVRMRPGLTCIWAVEGRDRLDVETVMKLDMKYIDNWSLSLDSRILLRTIPLVLLGRGAN